MASGNSASVQSFKKFVSEAELDEKRKKRQEEWEKVRQPHQPLEAPEEPVETRSLYEQLQAQKDQKQLEYDEQHKLKNQVRGLDDDEADFLGHVSERQQELEKERHLEELEALQEFRNSVENPSSSSMTQKPAEKRTSSARGSSTKKHSSQAELLSGAVKRKRSENSSPDQSTETESSSATAELSENKLHADDASLPTSSEPSAQVDSTSDDILSHSTGVARVVGVLPGLGVYTDSDHSDTSSSDSDIDTDIFRRSHPAKTSHEASGAASKHR